MSEDSSVVLYVENTLCHHDLRLFSRASALRATGRNIFGSMYGDVHFGFFDAQHFQRGSGSAKRGRHAWPTADAFDVAKRA